MTKKISIIFCAMILVLISCRKDFIVEDISKKTVIVNAPVNNLTTTLNAITFWWEPLDGAEKYTLQIVSPSFASVAQLVLDTSVRTTKYTHVLSPGIYQWRIKATNAGHSTDFQVFNLKVDTTSDLSAQVVNLLIPSNGSLTAKTEILFAWNNISSATEYNLQINNGLVLDTVLQQNNFKFTLSAIPNMTTAYTWNVKAINNSSESKFNSTPFTFTIDLKPPPAPSLNSPLNGAFVTSSVTLNWTRNATNDVLYDSVYVATDSLFANLISQTWVDKVSIAISALQNSPIANNTFYWWKVRSFDAVGNRSISSAQFKFNLMQ